MNKTQLDSKLAKSLLSCVPHYVAGLKKEAVLWLLGTLSSEAA